MPRVKRAPRKYNPRRGVRRSAYGRRVGFGGRYIRRAPRYATEVAELKEVIDVRFNNNVMTYYDAWSISDLALRRAPAVAQNYQYYKISKIEVKLLTAADTFIAGGAAGTGIMPQVYYMINKGQSIPTGLGVGDLLDMGCQPRPLNERNLNWSFAPAVLTADRNTAGGLLANQYKISPWLNTNQNVGGAFQISSVEHGGFIIYVSPQSAGDTSSYELQVTLHFKFKKPLVVAQSSIQSAVVKNGVTTLLPLPDGTAPAEPGATV